MSIWIITGLVIICAIWCIALLIGAQSAPVNLPEEDSEQSELCENNWTRQFSEFLVECPKGHQCTFKHRRNHVDSQFFYDVASRRHRKQYPECLETNMEIIRADGKVIA